MYEAIEHYNAYKAEEKIKHNHKVILQRKKDEIFATVSALVYFSVLSLILFAV